MGAPTAVLCHRGRWRRRWRRDHRARPRRWAAVRRAPPSEDREEDPTEEDQPQGETHPMAEALRQVVVDDDEHDVVDDRDEDPDQPPPGSPNDLQQDVEAVDRDERCPSWVTVRACFLEHEVGRDPDDDPQHDEVQDPHTGAHPTAVGARRRLREEHPRSPFREGPREPCHAPEAVATTYGENDMLLNALLVD